MNRLSISQITASLAVLLLATGSTLLMGAPLWGIVLPVLAGLAILLIAAQGPALQPIQPSPAQDVADIVAHPDRISQASVVATMLAGRWVHGRPPW